MTHAIWTVHCTVFFIFFTIFAVMISWNITSLMQMVRRISQQMIITVFVAPLMIAGEMRWKE